MIKIPGRCTCDNKRIIRCLTVVLISFVIAFMCFVFFSVGYEENDDTFMNLISVGAFGDRYSHYLIYSHVFIGIFLKYLNIIFPAINWYYLLMLLLNVLAVSVVCLYFSRDISGHRLMILTVIINILMSRDFYINLQYTKNAVLYCCAGILAFLLFVTELRYKDFVTGLLFCVLGGMVRFKCLLFIIPFGMISMALVCIRYADNVRKEYKKLIGSAAVLLLCIFAVWGTDNIAYSGEWGKFKQFNEYRTQIWDYTGVNYEAHRAEYESIGVSENDAAMFYDLTYADTDYFTIDLLKKIRDIEYGQGNNVSLRLNGSAIRNTSHEIREAFSESLLPAAFLMIVLMAVIWGDPSLILMVSCLIFTGYAEYWYLTCMGRVLWRVEMGIWLPLCLVTFFFLMSECAKQVENRNDSKKKDIASGILICVVILFVFWSYQDWNYRSNKNTLLAEYDSEEPFINNFRADTEHIYLGNFFNPVPGSFAITRNRFGGAFENICYAGGWFMPSPVGLYYINERGIANPFKALIDENAKMYYVCDSECAERMRIFLSEHYGKDVEAVNIDGWVWEYR